MSTLLTLTRRELADRRALLWGVLVAALVPLLARVLPWLGPGMRRDVHEALAYVFAITFPAALALGLGASVVGEDLAHRRLGFYFSRPVSGLALWASKTLAAVLVPLVTAVLFLAPALWLGEYRPGASLPDLLRKFPEWVLPGALVLVALVCVAEAVAGAYRARDGLFALDVALFAMLAAVATGIVWRLVLAGAAVTLRTMTLPALALVVVAAAAGAALQVIVGRSDAKRGHLALSGCLWGTLAVGLLGAFALSGWVLAASPADLGADAWSLRASASGSHVTLAARRDRLGYQPLFLLETATGRFQRLNQWRTSRIAFSADGRRAVWIEHGDGPVLVLHRLDDPAAAPIRSDLHGLGEAPALAGLSPDGRRAALATSARIAVVDTDSGRVAGSTTLVQLGVDVRMPLSRPQVAFVGNELVAFFVLAPSGPLVVSSFDVLTGRTRPGPKLEGVDHVRRVRDGRALVSGRRGPLAVVDRARATVLVPAFDEVGVLQSAVLLEEGRVAACVDREDGRRLLVWDEGGRSTLDVPFPLGATTVVGEPRRGWLALAAGPGQPLATSFVDIATGRLVRQVDGVIPAAAAQGQDAPPPADSPAARIFVGARGEVVRLDPDTGRHEAVILAAAPGARE